MQDHTRRLRRAIERHTREHPPGEDYVMTTDTSIIIALARKLEVENTRLRAENAALRAGQGRWPDDKPDDFPCCSGGRAKLQAEVDRLSGALRLARREKDEWESNYAYLVTEPPMVISAEELRHGLKIATFADDGHPVAGVVGGHASYGFSLLMHGDKVQEFSTDRTIVLLEDAPTSDGDDHRDAVVTAETIRASEPGSTWEDRHGAAWEWTGGGMAYHSQFGDLGEESLTEYVVQQSGPFTRSTAAPRGDYSTTPPLTVHALNVAPVGSLVRGASEQVLFKKLVGNRWHYASGALAEPEHVVQYEATLTHPERGDDE